jgi:hypothetical protein
MMRTIRLCRRANATRRRTTRRVTSATAPVATEADDVVTVRPMIAPIATATAKSPAPSWASMRHSPRRRPMTATANISTALIATPAETARPADQFQQPHHSFWNLVSFLLNAFAVPLPPDTAPMRAKS